MAGVTGSFNRQGREAGPVDRPNVVFIIAVLQCAVALAFADVGPRNLAFGREVVFSPAPSYRLTVRGGTDATDLTDGELSARKDRKLWFDAKAVGWSYAGLAQMAVDLGKTCTVGGVTMSWQGGSPQAGVCLPCWIHVLASEDGRAYYRVATCSRWNEGDRAKFKIPPDEGKAWVHQLAFRDIGVRARYVGIEIYGAGLSVADELWVTEAARADRTPADGEPSAFTVTGPRMYFHKPVVFVPTDVNAPTPIGWIVPPGGEKLRVTASIDLPKGVRFVGGRLGGTDLADAKPTAVDGGAYERYTCTFFAGKGNKSWRRVYLRAGWPDGRTGTLRYQLRWKGGGTPLVAQPIRAIRIPRAPTPERLMTGLGWWSLDATRDWPGALEAFRHVGFNTLPLFARWTKLDDPNVAATLGRFRKAGFRVMNIDSTFHHMLAKAGKRKGELACQFADGRVGERLCPSYRGALYHAELDRVARECVRCRADYLSCDIELWGWRGPVDCERCTRCRADFEKSGGKDWPIWRLAKGEEMWRDLAARVRAACRQARMKPPELGVYDFRPGRDYQYFWPFDRLYPTYMGNSQVSTYTPLYPYHLGLVGDEARADRARLPRSDVLPWLTPGDAGTFPGEAFTCALLECFANGSRGVHFWSGRVWDAETLAAYARALAVVAPVEDVIVDGKLVSGVASRPKMRISGMRRGDEMFLLLADYRSRRAKTVAVTLPPGPPRVVVDLANGETVARLPRAQRAFRLPFTGEPARAVHVKPTAE